VELEGVSYADFVVPECPQCKLEGQQGSFVRGSVIAMSPGSLMQVVQTKGDILR
jgi:hypothetical protein